MCNASEPVCYWFKCQPRMAKTEFKYSVSNEAYNMTLDSVSTYLPHRVFVRIKYSKGALCIFCNGQISHCRL